MAKAINTVYDALSSSTSLAALVGDRIWIEQPPQSAELPFVVIHAIGSAPQNDLDGDSGHAFVSISIEAVSNAVVNELIELAIRVALMDVGYYEDEMNDPDQERGIHRTVLDFTVHEFVDLD